MRVLAVVAALMLAHAVPAAADDAALAAARDALDKSDYTGARDALAKALATGDNDRDALVEIHRMTGIVQAALGDSDAATTAFERMLALAPKAELPAGTSPKIAKPFAAAKAYAKKHAPLAIDASTAASPPTVTVAIKSDPLQMIERIRAISSVDGGKDQLTEEPADASVTFALSTGTRIEVRVIALDEHGNTLAEIGSAEVPIVITGAGATPEANPHPDHRGDVVVAPPPGPRKERSTIAKWWLWTGVAVVFGGVAGGFAYDARAQTDKLERLNADSSNHRFSEALSVEHRARRDVLFANIGFGVAGGAAILATILFLTDHGGAHAPAEHQAVTATPVIVDGGGGLVVEVPF